jgi:hypothetical protein
MKRLQINEIVKFHHMNFSSISKILLSLLFSFILFAGFHAAAQCLQPLVKVRFANPQFDCPTQTYCVDVEFQSDTPDQQLFGMDIRFFYDGNILKNPIMGDFQEGYTSIILPQIVTNPPCDGASFGFTGPLKWFNGNLQLVSVSPIYLTTGTWTKLFNICFHVDTPHHMGVKNFCPSIVFDLQVTQQNGGFIPGDNGVVMTVVDTNLRQNSALTIENVIQFNWEYNNSGDSFGHHVSNDCITEACYTAIPLSNWALFLGIGLMMIATLFIWRRRMH